MNRIFNKNGEKHPVYESTWYHHLDCQLTFKNILLSIGQLNTAKRLSQGQSLQRSTVRRPHNLKVDLL